MTQEEKTDSLRGRALDFWRENRNASGTGLAIRFLQDGDGLQRLIAAESLITSEDPAAWQGLEQYILNDERAVSQHEFARRYLSGVHNQVSETPAGVWFFSCRPATPCEPSRPSAIPRAPASHLPFAPPPTASPVSPAAGNLFLRKAWKFLRQGIDLNDECDKSASLTD